MKTVLSTSPEDDQGAQEPASPVRPTGLRFLTGILLASPLLHGAALGLGREWLNFGSHRPWDGLVYFAAAPFVGILMLRRHERARFSVYVLLSCEIVRAVRLSSIPLGVLAAVAILYLQLPSVRQIHPPVDTDRVLRRIGLRRESRT
ncbi:MAG: hypothetical protein R3234_12020 [Thermoanaerobaculia bacterium]|nr:hypothetical protein [Thermoanaerobaculia bacterium]